MAWPTSSRREKTVVRGRAGVVRALLPPQVAVVDTRHDVDDAFLLPEEASVVRHAVPVRRREYTTTRHCARCALACLGVAPVPIGRGPRREPVWPAGVVGSLTHCDGYRAAAVAWSADVASVGIDAEPHAPLPDGVGDLIFDAAERAHLVDLTRRAPIAWDRISFSAKEAVYKAWFPLTGQHLDFVDAQVRLTTDGRFSARLVPAGVAVEGRWEVADRVIRTALVLGQAMQPVAGATA